MIIQSFGKIFHQSYLFIVYNFISNRSKGKWCMGMDIFVLFWALPVESALNASSASHFLLCFWFVLPDIYVNISDICIHSIGY